MKFSLVPLFWIILAGVTLLSTFPTRTEPSSSTREPALQSATAVTWSYKYLGAETNYGKNQGVRAEIIVTNPGVPHDGTYSDFFYAWVMIYSRSRTKWIQIGWAEASWKSDTQYVTEYDTEHNTWNFYTQYALTTGHSYSFAISYQGSSRWATWIWWNNQWNQLTQASIGLYSAELTGEFCEVCTSNSNWFHVPNTTFYSTYLLINDQWSPWTTQYSTIPYNSNPPYYVYWSPSYYGWYMHESGSA